MNRGIEVSLQEISEREFEIFFNQSEYKNFWQSVEMCHYRQNKGWNVHYIGIKEESNVIAACSLISYTVFGKYKVYECLRGFLIDYRNLELVDQFLKELKEYLHKNYCLCFKTNPYVQWQLRDKDGNVIPNTTNDGLLKVFEKNGFVHLGFRIGNDNNYEPRFQSVLPLEGKTEDQIFKEMNSHTRQNIKNTMKTSVKVRELTEEDYDILQKFVSMTGDRRHFLNPDLDYYKEFHHAFQDKMKVFYVYLDTIAYQQRYKDEIKKNQDELEHIEKLIEETPSKKNVKKKENCLRLIEASQKRVDEAKQLYNQYGEEIGLGAAMFIINSREIVYLFSGSDDTFKRYKGAYALQWQMIQYGIKNHISRYNFYGISGEFSEDAEGYGVYNFKKGFNADVEELIGDFEYIDRKKTYALYQGIRKIKNKIKK